MNRNALDVPLVSAFSVAAMVVISGYAAPPTLKANATRIGTFPDGAPRVLNDRLVKR